MPPKKTKAAVEKSEKPKITKKAIAEDTPSEEPVKKTSRKVPKETTEVPAEEVPSEEPVKKTGRRVPKETTEPEVPAEEAPPPVKKQTRGKPQKAEENGTVEESEAPMKKEKGMKKKRTEELETAPEEDISPPKKQKVTRASKKEVAAVAPIPRQGRSKAQSEVVQNGKPEPELKKVITKKATKDEKPASKPMPKSKKATEKAKNDDEKEEEEKKPASKVMPKSKKVAAEKAKKAEPKEAKAEGGLLNTTDTKWEEIDFGCKKTTQTGEKFNVKITSWNVDGLRAWHKKGGWKIMEYDQPDIFCLQETKCTEDKLPAGMDEVEGYKVYWCNGEKEGYAGVGVYTKIDPIEVKYGIGEEKHDDEGRCITLEFEKFFLVNVYVPNAGRGLVTLPKRLQWNESFQNYLSNLDKSKPVIVCGDMNVAHEEIDIANPKSNKKNAGFTKEEREGMTELLSSGFVDTFRELYPEEKDVYTFWSYITKARSKNIGWRLDYFITSNRLMKNVCDSVVRNLAFGSDHCPISLFLHI